MFREMTKKNKQLSREEALRLLREEPRGVLSLLGDEGYPYGVPTNFWYCDKDGCIWFHGDRSGHKMDAIRRCSKASLCVISKPIPVENSWAPDYRSVIVFGRIEIVEDPGEVLAAVREFSLQFTDDTAFIEEQIELYGHETACFRLVPEHITGKQINES